MLKGDGGASGPAIYARSEQNYISSRLIRATSITHCGCQL